MNNVTNQMPKVGDVFVSNWGYDQNNTDFYQVTKVLAKSVKVRPIDSNVVDTGMMTGESTPVLNSFCGDEKLHRINFGGDGLPGFRVTSFSWAFLTDPNKRHYCSWGH